MKDSSLFEDQFSQEERRFFRKERKLASFKDRSKFKKTDQDLAKKRKIPLQPVEGTLKGKVLSISIEGMIVQSGPQRLRCVLKGALKKETHRLKNLIAVGDNVLFMPGDPGIIVHIFERTSVLSKADSLAKTKEQLMAVNIDQLLITISVTLPSFKPFLVDRYIIAARKGNMHPLIVINKTDLLPELSKEDQALYSAFLKTYQDLKIPLYPVSAVSLEGLSDLSNALKGKTSVFSGQSGVGKTSLINALTGLSLHTGNVVEKTQKGSHTTTQTCLFPLQEGFCVDTPGIKSFGIWDATAQEIRAYFPEIHAQSSACKYMNCAHLQEPECAVKKAAEEGIISQLRLESYHALLESLSEDNLRR